MSRGEASDEILRIMIKVKTIAMLASGDLDTIILSAATLFGVAATDVKADEIYPAKVYLYIDEDKLDAEHKRVAEIIAGLMSRIKASGVGIRIFYQTYFGGAENLYIMSMRSNHIKITASPDGNKQKSQNGCRHQRGTAAPGAPADHIRSKLRRIRHHGKWNRSNAEGIATDYKTGGIGNRVNLYESGHRYRQGTWWI